LIGAWVSPALTGLNVFLWPTQAKAWAMFSWPFGVVGVVRLRHSLAINPTLKQASSFAKASAG